MSSLRRADHGLSGHCCVPSTGNRARLTKPFSNCLISATLCLPSLFGCLFLFNVLYLPLVSARNSLGTLVPLNLPNAISAPVTPVPPAPAALRQRMGLRHRLAAAPWTRRRAQALCCTLGRPPASAVNPSSTAQTATTTCHPRPCPGTHRSPVRREHPLIPPASHSRPGPTTSCSSQPGGGSLPKLPDLSSPVKGKQPPSPYQGLNPFIACSLSEHPPYLSLPPTQPH